MSNLIERDERCIWHPYSQHGLGVPPLPIKRAYGSILELEDGRRLIDGISSWWVNLHGHGHPEIAEAIHRQALRLDHVIFSGFTHDPGVELAEVLLEGARGAGFKDFERVFFSDNGSTAVEVALKMAYQSHLNRHRPARLRFIALSGSYHGDTLGAMGASDPEGYHAIFRPLLPQVDFVRPDQVQDLLELIDLRPGEHSAFIFEPLIQGAGGMRTYSASYLEEAVEICKKQGILTIADEVFTGFYRTGTMYASTQARIQPDFVCVSKGITGGVLPLSATLVGAEVFDAFKSERMRDAFLHGHSYTANPIACAAALASARILSRPESLNSIERIARETESFVQALRAHPGVKAARSLGTIGAVEMKQAPDYFQARWSSKIMRQAIERGVLLRPLGPVLYAVPPYCVTSLELERIYQTIKEIIHAQWTQSEQPCE